MTCLLSKSSVPSAEWNTSNNTESESIPTSSLSSWLMNISRLWEVWFWIPPGWEIHETPVFCWTAKCSCHDTIMQVIITTTLYRGCLFTKSKSCLVRCLPSAEGSVSESGVNLECGLDSHTSIPGWCQSAYVQLCLPHHIMVSTPHPTQHMGTIRLTVRHLWHRWSQ